MTTLDRLSHGRAILGVGLGNPIDAEYGTFGEPTDPRILAGRLDEGLEIVDGLLTGEPVRHAGAHYRVDRAVFVPRPVQRPRVPIWVACTWPHRRPVARAARWDGVIVLQMLDDELVPMGIDGVAAVAARIRRLRITRNPYDIAVVLPGLPHDPAGLEKAGATWVLVTGCLGSDAVHQLLGRQPIDDLVDNLTDPAECIDNDVGACHGSSRPCLGILAHGPNPLPGIRATQPLSRGGRTRDHRAVMRGAPRERHHHSSRHGVDPWARRERTAGPGSELAAAC